MDKINLKINRAKEHLNELSRRLNIFLQTKPYKIGIKNKENRPVYYILEAHDTPIEIAIIAGEIIQHLRSTLDQLAYKLFKINTPNGNDGRHIYFPISGDLIKYNTEKTSKTKGISQPAQDLIDTIQPYKGGNNILWQIHELNIIDKHRLLFTVGACFGGVDICAAIGFPFKEGFKGQSRSLYEMPSLFLKPADNLFPLKIGDELFVDLPNAKEIPDMKFQINVVINEPGVSDGQEIYNLLHLMVKEVETIIAKFERLV